MRPLLSVRIFIIQYKITIQPTIYKMEKDKKNKAAKPAAATPVLNADFCIKQTALQVKIVQKRQAKSPNGVTAPRKVYKTPDGKTRVQPCQFLVGANRAIVPNVHTHIYLSAPCELLLVELAHKLDMSGAVVDTANKLLSVVVATPEFAALAQKVADEMLALRTVGGQTTNGG
jgi:hypothetical protein